MKPGLTAGLFSWTVGEFSRIGCVKTLAVNGGLRLPPKPPCLCRFRQEPCSSWKPGFLGRL